MFRAIKGSIVKMLCVVAFIFLSFWPDIGVLAQCLRYFPTSPMLVAAGAAVWVVPLLLVLPITVKVFAMLSSSAVLTVYVVVTIHLLGTGVIASAHAMIIAVIGAVAAVLAWAMVAAPLWRWARGIVAVQHAEGGQ